MSRHLSDNAADRELGATWERHFCRMAEWYGKSFLPQQIGRTGAATWRKGNRTQSQPALLPDITIFSWPGEHHEIKHKAPSKYRRREGMGSYGYERYRLRPLVDFRLETQQPVFCTVHDWEAAGAHRSNESMPNVLQDWRVVDVMTLDTYITEQRLSPDWLGTWVNGQAQQREGYYWPVSLWVSLDLWWGLPE